MHASCPSVTQANSREKPHRRKASFSSEPAMFWLLVLASVDLGPSQAQHNGGRSVWTACFMVDRKQRGNMEEAPNGPVFLKGPSPVFYHLPTMSLYDESIEGVGQSSQEEQVRSN